MLAYLMDLSIYVCYYFDVYIDAIDVNSVFR